MAEHGGSSADWEALINHQSSTLTEIKNLVGRVGEMLEESQAQSKATKTTLRNAQWTLAVAVATLVASIALAFIAPLIVQTP
jgi:hypothetical protein